MLKKGKKDNLVGREKREKRREEPFCKEVGGGGGEGAEKTPLERTVLPFYDKMLPIQ
jgi:hypothetical protein